MEKFWKLTQSFESFGKNKYFRINSLLLADELRETILKEALGSDAVVPENYSWPPLDYPTSFDDAEPKPVNKIQHLRKEQ